MTSAFAPAFPLVQTAGTMTHETQGQRRGDLEDASFVRTFKSAETGVGSVVRLANVIISLIGFGAMIGMYYMRFNSLEASIDRMSASVSSISAAQTSLDKQTDRNTIELARVARENESLAAQLAEVRSDNRALTEQVNTLRNMREAYVYDSAKAARNKLLEKATTPP